MHIDYDHINYFLLDSYLFLKTISIEHLILSNNGRANLLLHFIYDKAPVDLVTVE